ncbi:hypothetical protein C8R44DRAFT_743162 [Mycena epipterygia]|nr:hypothetical protein C8R44DRAFT_743162 [Mycena epipterygia]
MNKFNNSGAISFVLWDPAHDHTPVFVIPVIDTEDIQNLPLPLALDWKIRGVRPVAPAGARKLTMGMASSVAALHAGVLGIPALPALAGSVLPTYQACWEVYNQPGPPLTQDELDTTISVANHGVLSGRAVFIVPDQNSVRQEVQLDATILQQYVASILKAAKNTDGPRQGTEFRTAILSQDDDRCTISGDQLVEAAHIIHRYIGSPIFSSVLEIIRDTCRLVTTAQMSAINDANPPILFADIRRVPDHPYPSTIRIDQGDNGEALAPCLHAAKDLHDAYCVYPPTGDLLWLDKKNQNNRHAISDFGLLSNIPLPLPPADRLFSNPQGHQPMDKPRFFPRCLHLYLVFCRRFMPIATKSAIVAAVAEATRLAELASRPNQTMDIDVSNPTTNEDPQGDTGGTLHLPPSNDQLTDADVIPANTSNGSNSSKITVTHHDVYADIWKSIILASSDWVSDCDEKERAFIKESLEDVFPRWKPDNLPFEELFGRHKELVLKAILLLHLGAQLHVNLDAAMASVGGRDTQ